MAEPITYGLVPRPDELQTAYIDKPYAWDDLGPRKIKGVCLHRTIGGELMTTERYFADPAQAGYQRALTDCGVAAKGYARLWNDPRGRRAPWASGPWNGGEGDGPEFVRVNGINAINRDLFSIELEGIDYDVPLTPKQIDTTVRVAAWTLDHFAQVPYSTFPRHPSGFFQAIYHHREFCGGWYKLCPGDVVIQATPFIVAEIRKQLKAWQTKPGIPQQPEPPHVFAARHAPPTFEGQVAILNGHAWFKLDPPQKITTTRDGVPVLEWATEKARPVRDPLPKGYGFSAVRVAEGDPVGGSSLWWITAAGSRIPMAYTTPKLTLSGGVIP